MTIEELLKNCTSAFQKPVPIVSVLDSQAAIKERFDQLEEDVYFTKTKNITAPAAFRFQRKIFDGKEKTACFLKVLSSEEDWRAHLTENDAENHVFIDNFVTPEIFFDSDMMPDFLTKEIPQDDIAKIVKNINDCLSRESLFSEWQAKNATMLAMGMKNAISIPFQWNTSLYYDNNRDHEYNDSESDSDDNSDEYHSEIDLVEEEVPVENFCELGDVLLINSGDAREPF